MNKIVLKPGETIERAVRRFKKQCNVSGLIDDMKKVEHYVKPSVERREQKKKNISNTMRERKQAFKNKAKMKKRKRLGFSISDAPEIQES